MIAEDRTDNLERRVEAIESLLHDLQGHADDVKGLAAEMANERVAAIHIIAAHLETIGVHDAIPAAQEILKKLGDARLVFMKEREGV